MRHHTAPSPRTGCWVPLIAAGMIFMNVASEIIVTGESLSTYGFLAKITVSGQITKHSQSRRRWWQRGWQRVFFISLSMHRCELKLINMMRSTLLFRRGQAFLLRTWQNNNTFILPSFWFPSQEFLMSPLIPSDIRWTQLLPLLDLFSHIRSWFSRPSGVQGEGELQASSEVEGECFSLACQCLAEIHALGGQGRQVLACSSSCHFKSFFWIKRFGRGPVDLTSL